jgi:hypothetical protein
MSPSLCLSLPACAECPVEIGQFTIVERSRKNMRSPTEHRTIVLTFGSHTLNGGSALKR